MARFSPFSDKRPAPFQETVTLTHQRTGAEDEITLQYLDDILQEKANDVALKLTFQYVGVPEQDILPTDEFPAVDGQYLDISSNLCQKVANLYVMQAPRPDRGVIYSCEELIAFAATDASSGIWTQLQEEAQKVNAKGNKRKNEFRASVCTGLKTPLDGNNHIRKSLPEPTSSSVVSTNGSESSVTTSPEPLPVTT